MYYSYRSHEALWNVGSFGHTDYFRSALSLLVIGILGADDHYLAVSFDNLAFVAHGFYGSTNFHKLSPC